MKWQALAIDSGHYTPKSLTEDLKRLSHDPEIWLTGMKPGEEAADFRAGRQSCPREKHPDAVARDRPDSLVRGDSHRSFEG